MTKRKTVKDRIKKKDSVSEFEKMMQPTIQKEVEKASKNEEIDPWKQRRQTYYIPEILIDALQIQKAFENKDISETVREALLEHIDDKYLNMAEDKYR